MQFTGDNSAISPIFGMLKIPPLPGLITSEPILALMSKRNTSLSDEALLQALKINETEALEHLYREVFPQVAHFILQNNGAMDDAQDIFQEAMLVTMRYIKKPDFELTVQLNTFLVTIARNMWFKRLRQDKKMPLQQLDALPFSLPDVNDGESKQAMDQQCTIVVAMLDELGEECRKLLTGFYFDKKSLQELAAELGYTDGFVRVKKGRCMADLRKRVENHPDFNVS